MSRFTAPASRLISRSLPVLFGFASLLPLSHVPAFAQVGSKAPQTVPYTITSVAGGGTYGTTYTPAAGTPKANPFSQNQSCGAGSSLTASDGQGDGCLATQVLLTTPRSVAADSQGNLFLVDSNNELIRRVDARTGIITTVAGSTTVTTNPAPGAACANGNAAGLNGDNCAATSIYLSAPEGVAVDPSGNVWFSDYNLGSVRKINKVTGIITTIVNTSTTTTGTTTSALGYNASNANAGLGLTNITAAAGVLAHPYGIAFDKKGNLYIADEYNDTVEAVNLGTTPVVIAGITIPAGVIYTIAGSGCAYTITTDCDAQKDYGKTGNGNPSTSSTLDSPYDVAVDNAGNIYIADEYPYDVRVINGSTGILTTFANGSFSKLSGGAIVRGPAISTSLANVYGVATDSFGNVYIATYDSTTTSGYIARVDVNATAPPLYVIAGTHATAAPASPDAAQPGAVVCSTQIDPVGDGCPATQASFYKPYKPTVDSQGNVYVVDQGNGLIRKISAGTAFPTTSGTVTQTIDLHFPSGDKNGSVTLTNGSSDFTLAAPACAAANATDMTVDCTLAATFTPTAPGVRSAPVTVTSANGQVSQFTLTGIGQLSALTLDPGVQKTLAATGVTAVSAVAADNAGDVFAAVPGATSILKITPAGVTSNLGTGISNATAVAVDGFGNVFAATGTSVVEVSAAGAQSTFATGFTSPAGLATDSFGNVYVADSSTKTITQIVAGTGAQIVVPASITAGLGGPTGLAVDASGNIYIADTANNSIVELPANGAYNGGSVLTLNSGLGLSSPSAVALDAAGSLYIADKNNKRILYVPNESGTLTAGDKIAIITGLTAPTGIALSGGGTAYVADGGANTLLRYTRATGSLNFFNDQTGVAVTGSADILSAGTVAVTFGSTFFTETGNTSDFSLTPTAVPSSSKFPATGYGITLTPSFDATAVGARSAVFTFGGNAASTLTLSGNGINPSDVTTTTASVATTSNPGTYGDTASITITVATVIAGQPVSTGTVNVLVDATAFTETLGANGAVTFPVTGLNAGTHTVTATYTGDTNSKGSTSAAFSFTLIPKPLTITVNSVNKAFGAAVPTLTGTLTGLVTGDVISVAYSTTATASSLQGKYPITATYSGSAATNYTITIVPGTLTVGSAPSVVTLTTSGTSINGASQVVLTAMIAGQTTTAGAPTPTGSVTFFSGSTVLGTGTVTGGVATVTTSFANAGTPVNYAVTANYSGDADYFASTSTPLAITSGPASFGITPSTTALTVAQGQSGLISFTLQPTFSPSGTVTFGCTGLPALGNCGFSPATLPLAGNNTPSIIAVNLNTTQAGPLSSITQPSITQPRAGGNSLVFAALPGLALLIGLAGRRRKHLRGYRALLLAMLCLLGVGLSGCGAGPSTPGTAAGAYNITVTATASGVTQQFNVQLTVQ